MDQYTTWFKVCFSLKTPHVIYIVHSFTLNSQTQHLTHEWQGLSSVYFRHKAHYLVFVCSGRWTAWRTILEGYFKRWSHKKGKYEKYGTKCTTKRTLVYESWNKAGPHWPCWEHAPQGTQTFCLYTSTAHHKYAASMDSGLKINLGKEVNLQIHNLWMNNEDQLCVKAPCKHF